MQNFWYNFYSKPAVFNIFFMVYEGFMKIIKRTLQNTIEKWLFKGKILTIFGARQVGKTTLAKTILDKFGDKKDYFNCDFLSIRESFEQQNPDYLKRIIGNSKIIVIDEAQRVKNIGLILKILNDTFPETQIIATGSSSFELANKINEPLTGRALEFILYPFSLNELQSIFTFPQLQNQLEFFLRFGSYPEIVDKSEQDAIILLDNLTGKYLYKDIFEFEQIRKSDKLVKLLQLLSFQVGNQVSIHELSTQLGINRETVERYIDLLEKAFVIFRLKPFSRNLRKELTKKEKIYFFDLGIRNSLIRQFQPLEFRSDKGALFENFCILERRKYLQKMQLSKNHYFWRTHDRKEIDLIEEHNNQLHCFEFKYGNQKYKIPAEFLKTYQNSTISVINEQNIWDFAGI